MAFVPNKTEFAGYRGPGRLFTEPLEVASGKGIDVSLTNLWNYSGRLLWGETYVDSPKPKKKPELKPPAETKGGHLEYRSDFNMPGRDEVYEMAYKFIKNDKKIIEDDIHNITHRARSTFGISGYAEGFEDGNDIFVAYNHPNNTAMSDFRKLTASCHEVAGRDYFTRQTIPHMVWVNNKWTDNPTLHLKADELFQEYVSRAMRELGLQKN